MKSKSRQRHISRCGIIAFAAILLLLTAMPLIAFAEEPLIFIDFEDGTISGFIVRGTETERENNGTGILHASTDAARSGDYSLLITDRQRAWNGVAFNIAPFIKAEVTYEISFWVHAKTPDTSSFTLSTQITETGPPWINLSVPIDIGVSDGWVQIAEEHTYSQSDIDTGHITVYIENSTADAEFYVDDFSVTALGGGAAWNPLTDPITSNKIGTFDGFDYEFWSERGDGETKMQLTGPGTFWCSWAEARNILFRTGKKLGSVMSLEEYGNVTIEYEATHNIESGHVSYLTAYGWTQNPLMEWYIIEQHGEYKPGKTLVDTVIIDGAEYEIIIDTRTNQPSIEGTQTFQQIFSIRKDHRTEGIITVSDHFKAWEELGLDVSGKLYEVSMCIEAYGTSGRGNGSISKHILTVGDTIYGDAPDRTPAPQETLPPPPTPDTPAESSPDPIPDISDKKPTPPENSGGGDFFWWGIALAACGIAAVAIVYLVVLLNKNKK